MPTTTVTLETTAEYDRFRDTITNGGGAVTEIRDRYVFKAGHEFNRQQILDRSAAALTANDTYLAIGSPTNAQVAAQVRTLTKECNGLIRLLLDQLGDVSDT